ncbi:hypothetical protein P175DRAFT_0504098 [Aspergillus ochraceoroseus IBT 24754]|uniref:AB hydrolase-1 domain-containing protein n=2 Tax=Aspergillus ochraceoroseus TaxID=138278 RepID=A0A2T5LPJ6_9EURO|nr:uncharacterized protein P175DRAFT_0504098 [Aspergillus ochraceoroseus IBT 24754]KKK14912.1 hypothetical protein AOCH_001208 [Aspergillus ochraceoroseus]PTU18198.1 hypothetical protein P175DRAFT_0504098 [Aspergillus ochraceoroseus IBT 24754]
MPIENCWETGEHDGLISIGTHRLFASIFGPDRTSPTVPVVIILPGAAASIKEWVAMRRMLQPSTRVFLYERSGLGSSDESPPGEPPTAETIARELDLLLQTLAIKPPYVLVCHSYGGVTSREFLHRKQESGTLHEIAGMVFVDANQERNSELWPDSNFDAVSSGIDTMEVTGLNHSVFLSDAERSEMIAENASAKHRRAAAAEMAHYRESCAVLGRKKQLEAEVPLLGSRPVSVLKGNAAYDLRKIYAAGVAAGSGSPEERMAYQQKLDTYDEKDESFQRRTTKLSSNSRFSSTPRESGHCVHLTQPDAIIREIQWVLDHTH